MAKTKFKDIINCMNSTPSGSIVGITDYIGNDGIVTSVQGQIGTSYSAMKLNAISELAVAIDQRDFEDITVAGVAWAKPDSTGQMFFCTRKSKDAKLVKFVELYDSDKVIEFAEEILESWKNSKERTNNKKQLTDKQDGLSFNEETGSFNFSLVVIREWYKKEKTLIEQAGQVATIKASHPDTVLKKKIRARFEKKYKSFTIGEGKFTSLSIGGTVFESDNITL